MTRLKTIKLGSFLALGLLALTLVIFPAQAAPAAQATPRPLPTHKACHVCGDEIPLGTPTPEPDGVVHAVMFWMLGCGHCEYIRANTLPLLQAEYGPAFDLLQVKVDTRADVDLLYAIGDRLGIGRVGVPLLLIGDHVLLGSQEIPEKLPGLIEEYIDAGGVPAPVIPELEKFSSLAAPAVPPSDAVVRMILFSTLDCSACDLTIRQALAPLQETHAGRMEFITVDVVTAQDVEYLYQVAAGYGLDKDEVELPLIIIGEHILIDQEIAAELPALLDEYLAQGGVDFPSLPPRADAAPVAAQPVEPSAPVQETPLRPNGFTLAIVVLVLMCIALVFSLAAFFIEIPWPSWPWLDWLFPVLIVIGMGVAGYLSYVETQSVSAVCGPVGDCNAVQDSPYATLFGFLPIGVLGLMGYAALLAAWLAHRFIPRLRKLSALGMFGMAFFGVAFSIYLTYLEPFVIQAVCMWCISSAIIMTLLLILSLPPAIRQLNAPGEHE